jgi:mannitol/fructose-specific phosphotransferase system IIA component (Ntr-type)
MVQEQLAVTLPVAEQQLLDQQLQALQWQSRTGTSEQSQQILERFLRGTLAAEAVDHTLIRELAQHLGETLERLKRGIVIHNPETETIKKQFPFSFERAVQLASQLCDQYQLMMSDDEIAYVALHFQSFLERQAKTHQISAIVVCSSGTGWMRLLRQRLMARYESQMTIQRVMTLAEFQRTPVSTALIITTVPLPQATAKVVVVSALLNQLDQEKIQLALQQLTVIQDPAQPLLNLLDPTAIYWRSDLPDAPAAIRFLGQQLIQRGLATEGVLVSTLSREIFSSTVVRQTAMPAAQVNEVLQPSLSMLIAPKGINWYGQSVQVVFFLALDHSAQAVLPEIYQGLTQLKTTAFVKQLVKCTDAAAAYQLIQQQLTAAFK